MRTPTRVVSALALLSSTLPGCAGPAGSPGDAPSWRTHAPGLQRDGDLTFGPDDREADGTLSATAAIDDPENAGRTIRLEEGTYRIQQRWVLQEGMEVIGAGRDLTVVDGTDVLWSGLDDDYRALVGMGVANLVEGLTVRKSRLFAMIGNEPGGIDAPPFSATLRDVRVQGPSPAPVDEVEEGVYLIRPVAHSPMGVSFNGGDSPGETSTVDIEDTIVDGILGNTGCDPRYFAIMGANPAISCPNDDGTFFASTRGFGIFLIVGYADATLQASIRNSQVTNSRINLISEVMATGHAGRIELDTSGNVFGGPGRSGWGAGIVAGGDAGTGAYPDPTVHEPMGGVTSGHTVWTSQGDRFVGANPLVLAGSLDHWADEESTSCVYFVEVSEETYAKVSHPPPCAGSPGHVSHDLVGEEFEWVLPGSGPVRRSKVTATFSGPIFEEGGSVDMVGFYGKPPAPARDRCRGSNTDTGPGGCENVVAASVFDPLVATETGLEPLEHVRIGGNCDPSQPNCHTVDAVGNEVSIDVWQ